MYSLYLITFEIDFELICHFEQDLFPIIFVFFIFFYSIILFLCIVLVCQVGRQADLLPSHRVVVLFFFKLIQLIFILNHLFSIPFSLFSSFCVILAFPVFHSE